MNNDFKFNLKDRVIDNITGASGVIVARAEWLHSPNNYGVVKEESTLMDPIWLDESRLELE